jgi:SAM-dependent methyltransferase
MSAGEREQSTQPDMSVIWHDLECGAYDADLPLWERLAEDSPGPVLDLGCGTGRVALHLARRGHRVVAVEQEVALVEALLDRADGLPVEAHAADATELVLGEEFGLALAPMQLAQLLGGDGRIACLSSIARHLLPGGRAAFALVEELPQPVDGPPPLPDAREIDGWIYSSLPLDATLEGDRIVVRRLRQTVSPEGELSDEVDEICLDALSAGRLEEEAASAGLRPGGRAEIPATADHVGSSVVVLEGRS